MAEIPAKFGRQELSRAVRRSPPPLMPWAAIRPAVLQSYPLNTKLLRGSRPELPIVALDRLRYNYAAFAPAGYLWVRLLPG
jgi:hypothetical protein